MTAEEFIDGIKIRVVDGSVQSIHSILIDPPGRSPAKEAVENSLFFKSLSKDDKEMVMKIVRESVEMATFGFLCVLDGVAAIEDSEGKGELLLYYEKNKIKNLINDPDEEYLHDLLKQAID